MNRYAPHLEKCLGGGRLSSRIATKRISSATQDPQDDNDEGSTNGVGEDDQRADPRGGGVKAELPGSSGSSAVGGPHGFRSLSFPHSTGKLDPF